MMMMIPLPVEVPLNRLSEDLAVWLACLLDGKLSITNNHTASHHVTSTTSHSEMSTITIMIILITDVQRKATTRAQCAADTK